MCSCTTVRDSVASRSFWMMDTYITVKLYGTEKIDAESVLDCCESMVSELEKEISYTLSDSEVSNLNGCSERAEVGADTFAILSRSEYISVLTGGAFDVTCAPISELWRRCAERNSLPTDAELTEALSNVGYSKIILLDDGKTVSKASPEIKVDLGGIGKGYAVDKVIEYLKTTGVSGGLVSFGSNVAVFGEKPDGSKFKIGIKDPNDTSGVIGYIYMSDGVLSVSGDYERYVEIGGVKYHHITDTATGYPASSGLRSVAVICNSGTDADAMSTALFVMGENAGQELYSSQKAGFEFEAIFISDTSVSCTEGLNGVFEKK